METKELLHIDKEHIWHPYSSATNPITPYIVSKAQGVFLELQNGQKLIDGMSSWWSVIHGYNHPKLNNAMQFQLANMSHVMFGGLTHEPAIQLTQKLLQILPPHLQHVFYSDSGSVSVEVALKMAIQYWYSKGEPTKQKFVSLRGGYHGDTWHAMSVCDPETGMHHLFAKSLPQQFFVERPATLFDASQIEEVRKLLFNHHDEIAAFIFEPVVQGAGGMHFYDERYLREIQLLCREFEVLLIADEIATGFGRTGSLFASQNAGIEPDIMCLGKAITGGYMSFAATVCTKEVARSISKAEPGVFMHGPTFMANPLACSVAVASLEVLLQQDWKKKVLAIESYLSSELNELSTHNAVASVRVKGAIGVVEMKEPVEMNLFTQACVNEGIWLRPFGKLVYVMPPYIISDHELDLLVRGIKQTIKKAYG